MTPEEKLRKALLKFSGRYRLALDALGDNPTALEVLEESMTEDLTEEELREKMQRNWVSWQCEESADRSYDPKMVDFYRQRYYYYKNLLDEMS